MFQFFSLVAYVSFFRRLGLGVFFSILGHLGSFWLFFCAICGLFTPKVEVSGKEGKIPLSCSELFLTTNCNLEKSGEIQISGRGFP